MIKTISKELFLKESMNALDNMLESLKGKPSLNIDELNPENTVLVMIDMINGFCKGGNLYSPRVESLIDKTVRILKLCKERGIKVIAFADSHTEASPELKAYPVHCMRGTFESEVIDELKAVGGYTLIEKNSTNSFLEKEFQEWLKANPNITNMIVIGDCTDICVEQFSNSAKAYFNIENRESRIIVPMDAVETFDSEMHKAELLNVVSLYMMAGNGIELVKTIEGLGEGRYE